MHNYCARQAVAKIAFVMLGKDKRKETGANFLKKALTFYPYKINYILTDNGFEFTYKALPKHKRTNKIHPFEAICRQNKIQHRTIKFKRPQVDAWGRPHEVGMSPCLHRQGTARGRPWTNGMVERFNCTVKEQVLRRYLFSDIFEMNGKLIEFINRYNFEKRLKSLNCKKRAQYLKEQKDIIIECIVI